MTSAQAQQGATHGKYQPKAKAPPWHAVYTLSTEQSGNIGG